MELTGIGTLFWVADSVMCQSVCGQGTTSEGFVNTWSTAGDTLPVPVAYWGVSFQIFAQNNSYGI